MSTNTDQPETKASCCGGRWIFWIIPALLLVAVGAAGALTVRSLLTDPGHARQAEPTGTSTGTALVAQPGESFGSVADFNLTDRTGRQVSRRDLDGRVWVAGFFFTRCAGACPVLTGRMARIQHDIAHPDLRLVSFNVDPEHDTPEVIARFADSYRADPDRWFFLTGERDDIYRLIRSSFHLAVEETPSEERTPGNEVTHSSRLVLVDRAGNIRGYYESTDEAQMRQLHEDTRRLLENEP